MKDCVIQSLSGCDTQSILSCGMLWRQFIVYYMAKIHAKDNAIRHGIK